MPSLNLDREERADRWLTQIRDRTMPIEPDWWLRLQCGQVADAAADVPTRGKQQFDIETHVLNRVFPIGLVSRIIDAAHYVALE